MDTSSHVSSPVIGVFRVGTDVAVIGTNVGLVLGAMIGTLDGAAVGRTDGPTDGSAVGITLGPTDGRSDG